MYLFVMNMQLYTLGLQPTALYVSDSSFLVVLHNKLLLWLLRTQEKPVKGVDPEEETFRQFVIRHKKPYLNDKNGEFLKTSSCDIVFLSCG